MFENLVIDCLKSYNDSEIKTNLNMNNNIYNILLEFYNAFKNNEFLIPCNLKLLNNPNYPDFELIFGTENNDQISISINKKFPIQIKPIAISRNGFSDAHYIGKIHFENINLDQELQEALQKIAIENINEILNLENWHN